MQPKSLDRMKLLLAGLILMLASPSFCSGQEVKVGERVPDFAFPSVDGRTMVRLSDYRGRRVLIFTWASW